MSDKKKTLQGKVTPQEKKEVELYCHLQSVDTEKKLSVSEFVRNVMLNHVRSNWKPHWPKL